ncbi:phage tail tape measure protein [Rothia nasimurium]|uniref:Phage tail tape measure protein n=1 Tax=Luteibacter anthropi TaxID=564369 RepID=A0A7X5ZIT8_9GAMM|nr:hypothetical protein [Luteibacter anthropi]
MADETARLVVAVDSTSATKATDVLDTMTASAGNAEAMVEALSKAFGPVAAEIAKLTAAIDRQVSSYASLDSAGQKVAATSEQAAKAAETQAQATEALGETADQARDRIRAMVSASLDQVRADAAAIEATQRRSDASRTVAADLNSEANSVRRAQESIAAFRQRTEEAAQSSRGAAKGVDEQRAALDKLLKQIDPTIAALEKLDQQEAELKQFKAAGMLGGDDFDRFMSTIQQRRKDVSDVGEAMHGFSLNTAAARREVGTLVSELARGNFGDFQRSLITLAGDTGIFSALLSPAAIGVGALALAIGGLAAISIAGYNDQQQLTKAIIATGDSAGVTAAQVNGMVVAIGGNSGQYGKAREALLGLVESGRLTGDSLQQAGQLAVDMAEVTGKSIGEAVQHIVSLRDDPVKAVRALDEQYNLLTANQYEHIKALVEQGQQERAVAEIQAIEAAKFSERRKKYEEDLGYLAKSWLAVRDAISQTLEKEKQIGSGSDTSKLNLLDQKIAGLKGTQVGGRGQSDQDFAARLQKSGSPLYGQYQELLDAKHRITVNQALDQWTAEQAAYDKRIQDEGKRASDTLDDFARRAKADDAKAKDIAKVKEATQKALAGRPQDKAAIKAQQAAALKYIDQQYTDKAGRSASKALDTAEVSAEASAFKSALAQITTSYTNAQKELDAQRKAGAVSEQAYYEQSRDLLWRGEGEQVTAIQAEMARLQQRKVAGAEKVKNDQRMAELSAEAHKVEADAISRDTVLQQEAAGAKERTTRAINAYVEALGRQESAARADADLQVQRLSMGDREFANMQRVISIRRQGADDLVRLASQLSNNQIDRATYDQQAEVQQASTDRLVQIELDAQARIASARESWTTGARKAMGDLSDQAMDAAGSFYSFVTTTSGSLSDFLVNAATTGKASIKDFVSSILKEVARLEANRAAASLLSYGLSFIPGLGGDSVPSTGTSGGFSLTGGTYSGGGSFATNWLAPARANGGSVDRNSLYRVAENGPEVYQSPGGDSYLLTGQEGGRVVPMRAGGGQAQSAGGVQVNVTVNVASDGSTSGQVDAAGADAVGRDLGQQMQAVAEQVLARSMQPGGKLWRSQRG